MVLAFNYETLQRAFWYHTDPLDEADRLLDLYAELERNYDGDIAQIPKDAEKILKKYAKKNGEAKDQYAVRAHCLMAEIYMLDDDYDNARRHANIALRADPASADALDILTEASDDQNPAPSLRGSAMRFVTKYLKDYDVEYLDRAVVLVRLALEHDTRNQIEASYYILACEQIAREQNERALEYLEVALRHDPTHKKSLELQRQIEQEQITLFEDLIATREEGFPYRPSPSGSPIAGFIAEFHETHNWNLNEPIFRIG